MRERLCAGLAAALLVGWVAACASEDGTPGSDAGDALDAADDAGDGLETDVPGETADEGGNDGSPRPPASEDWSRDIVGIALLFDLTTLEGRATLELAPSDGTGASFEAGGLDVRSVADADGPLEFRVVDGRLDVGVPATGAAAVLTVTYGFSIQPDFNGYMSRGSTLTWPWHCGNLFPCHSDPSEGQIFEMEVAGVPDGETAVYPQVVPTDAPSYQIAWTRGDYTYHSLGTTTAGTEVGYWTLPGGETAAASGTASLVAAVDWLESTLGPYPFGDRLGAVQVNWSPGAYGGMEHHPFWHVSTPALGDAGVHIHEAAHGWFGDGVRIGRWEDLVLSEGTASFLQARTLGQADGPETEEAVWAAYERELDAIVAGRDGIAWPDPIDDRRALLDWLFGRTTYMKGAYFYRAVADAVGAGVLDAVLARFFADHVGDAAGMQDMLDLILSETGFDPAVLAEGWLRSLGRPDGG